MVTVHHNGDVVTAPDHAENYKRRQREYMRTGKCRYGVKIWSCQAAREFKAKVTPPTGRVNTHSCHLHKCELCPKYKLHRDYGNEQKTFKMTNRHYRQIADRAAWMKENQKHKLLFITLTFGKWKSKPITDEEANNVFSKFMENFKKTYKRGNYLAVRERGEDRTKRIHYHVIVDMPYIDFKRLNNAWCTATSDFCHYSPNALTTDRKARYIRSTVSAVRYICKYISKARTDSADSRIIFASRDVTQAITTMRIKQGAGNTIPELFSAFRYVQIYKHNDFTWRYSISAPKGSTKEERDKAARSLNAFYYQIVRLIFGYADNRRTELYCFPAETPQ